MQDTKHRQTFINRINNCIELNTFWAIKKEERTQSADVNKEKSSQVRNRTKCRGLGELFPPCCSCLCTMHPKEDASVSSSQSFVTGSSSDAEKQGLTSPRNSVSCQHDLLSFVTVAKEGHLWSSYNVNFKELMKAWIKVSVTHL